MQRKNLNKNSKTKRRSLNHDVDLAKENACYNPIISEKTQGDDTTLKAMLNINDCQNEYMPKQAKKQMEKSKFLKANQELDEETTKYIKTKKTKRYKRLDEESNTEKQSTQNCEKASNSDASKGKKRPWTEEEDALVLKLVEKYGPQKWTFIADHLPGRIGKQCRERWHNHLNPQIKKCAWSDDEEWLLFLYHKAIGNKWADIAKSFFGRTDNSIKNHWNSSMKKKIPEFQVRFCKIKEKGLNEYVNSTKMISNEKELLEKLIEMNDNDYHSANQISLNTNKDVKETSKPNEPPSNLKSSQKHHMENIPTDSIPNTRIHESSEGSKDKSAQIGHKSSKNRNINLQSLIEDMPSTFDLKILEDIRAMIEKGTFNTDNFDLKDPENLRLFEQIYNTEALKAIFTKNRSIINQDLNIANGLIGLNHLETSSLLLSSVLMAKTSGFVENKENPEHNNANNHNIGNNKGQYDENSILRSYHPHMELNSNHDPLLSKLSSPNKSSIFNDSGQKSNHSKDISISYPMKYIQSSPILPKEIYPYASNGRMNMKPLMKNGNARNQSSQYSQFSSGITEDFFQDENINYGNYMNQTTYFGYNGNNYPTKKNLNSHNGYYDLNTYQPSYNNNNSTNNTREDYIFANSPIKKPKISSDHLINLLDYEDNNNNPYYYHQLNNRSKGLNTKFKNLNHSTYQNPNDDGWLMDQKSFRAGTGGLSIIHSNRDNERNGLGNNNNNNPSVIGLNSPPSRNNNNNSKWESPSKLIAFFTPESSLDSQPNRSFISSNLFHDFQYGI